MEQRAQQPTAIWSETLDCWLESDDETESLFSVPSAVWSAIFPRWVTWDQSGLYELPMSELPTAACDVSSPLFQTPSVADSLGGHERRGGKRAGELLLKGQVKELTLLPTPDASPEKYRLAGDSQQSKSLPAMAARGDLCSRHHAPLTAPRVDLTNAVPPAT